MFRKPIRAQILALFFISIGGLLLHARIHSVYSSGKIDAFNIIPVGFGIITTALLPFWFNCKCFYKWAYLINLAAVVIGTITMAYHSISTWSMDVTIYNVIFFSTLADILILMAKLPLGQSILNYWKSLPEAEGSDDQ